jgi:hypothetical protein
VHVQKFSVRLQTSKFRAAIYASGRRKMANRCGLQRVIPVASINSTAAAVYATVLRTFAERGPGQFGRGQAHLLRLR